LSEFSNKLARSNLEKGNENAGHAILRVSDIKSFLENSIAHHYALIHGDVEKELEES
jgi:L-fucose isomerase-like protein